MGMDTKTALSIYVAVQLVTFGLFIYLMTTVNPKQVNVDELKSSPPARQMNPDKESVVRLLRKNHSSTPSVVTNATASENITKTVNKKQKVKTFRRNGISSDNDVAIVNAPVMLPNVPTLYPLHRDGKDMVAIISNSSTPCLHNPEDNICNKTSCVYRLVTTATVKDLDHDIMQQIRFGRLFPPVHGEHPVKGFRRSLKDNIRGEIEKDTVLLKFLGIDHDGAPMIEIRVGPNLIIANPLSGRDASLIKWVPYPIDTSTDTVELRNETDREIDNTMKTNNSLNEMKFTNETEDFTKDFQKNTNSTNVTQFFTEVLEDVKNLISTRLIAEKKMEVNENSTVLHNDSKLLNYTDLVLQIETDPHKSDSRDYEINFGGSSELPITNESEPKMQPDVEPFLFNSTTESLFSLGVENVTEITAHPALDTNSNLLNISLKNVTEINSGNTTLDTSLTLQNSTNETQSFNSVNIETINVSEKRKKIRISIENNTLVNNDWH